MNNKELEILKDKYALDTLTQTEHASLEVAILQDPDLEIALKTHKDLVKGVQYAGELELQSVLDKIHYQQSSKTPSSNHNKNKYFMIVVLTITAVVSGYYLLDSKNNTVVNPSKIYAEFYTQYQPSLQDRGASLDEAITTFNEFYAAENFEEALKTIKPFLANSNNDIKLAAAIAANEVNDQILANNLLSEIIASKDYYFADHATWYKALIKLKSNDTSSIKEILTPLINNPKADHHEEAILLISEISGS